jgi:hypothetical protein
MKRQTRWFTRRTRRAIHGPRRANVSLCNTTTGLKNLLQSFFFFKFFADPIQSHHLIPPQRRWRGEKFVITPITYELKTKNKIIHFLSPLFNYIYLPATCIIIECLTWKKKTPAILKCYESNCRCLLIVSRLVSCVRFWLDWNRNFVLSFVCALVRIFGEKII